MLGPPCRDARARGGDWEHRDETENPARPADFKTKGAPPSPLLSSTSVEGLAPVQRALSPPGCTGVGPGVGGTQGLADLTQPSVASRCAWSS